MFDMVGLKTPPGQPVPVLEVCPFSTGFGEPSPGQEFWASIPMIGVEALREAQRGPLVLGYVGANAPFDARTATVIEQTLGFKVDARPQCAYASSGIVDPAAGDSVLSLWDAVFPTTPTTSVGPFREADIVLDGRDYRVQTTTEFSNEVYFAVYRP